MYITLCETMGSADKFITCEQFLELLRTKKQIEQVKKVRAEKDEEKRKQLKKKLARVMFQGYSTDGHRVQASCKSTGLVMVDFDDVGDARTFYKERVEPLKELISLRLAHVSAGGEGLHLVCDLQPGLETLKENMEAISELIGFKYDEANIDFSRLGYLATEKDILYLDPAMFTDEPRFVINNPLYVEEADVVEEIKDDAPAEEIKDDAPADENTTAVAVVKPESGSTELKEERAYDYKGIPISKIEGEYWLSRGGAPMKGERHNEILRWLQRLKWLCEFDAEKMRKVVGDGYGLDEKDLQRMIRDAISFQGSGKMPYDLYRILNHYGVVDDVTEVESMEEQQYPVNEEDIPYDDLHPLLKWCVDICPPGFKVSAIFVVTTIMGFLLTRLRARYYKDDEIHSPSFLTTIEAPFAQGKSFAKRFVTRLLKVVKAKDDIARQEEYAYQKELRRSRNSKAQPEEPTSFIRIVPGRSSVSKQLERQVKAQGLHLFSYDSEISNVMGNQKASWADKSSYYRHAFDNDPHSQDYKSDNATSADVDVYYNFVFAGTPCAVDALFVNPEDGLNSRIVPTTVPDEFAARMHKWGSFTKAQEKKIDQMLELCEKTTYDEDGNIRPEIWVDMKWMYPFIDEWLEEYRVKALKNDNHAMDSLRKRASVIGFRMAMIFYVLFSCKKASRQKIVNLYRWAATTTLMLQLNRFGDEIEAVYEKNERRKNKVKKVKVLSGSQNLFDSLPAEFTAIDVNTKKTAYGLSREARKIISDFVSSGIAKKIAPGKWQKTA